MSALIEKSTLPEGTRGDWAIKRFTVSEETAKFERMRAVFKGGRGVPAGTYTSLTRRGAVIMSDTPDEMRDHWEPVHRASGHVLINGLGLGMVLAAVLKKPEVTGVTVVEISADVVALVGPHFQDPRVEIVTADAFDYMPPVGARYGAVWHDIWDHITADNLPEMTRLRRKYGRRAFWQGCWAEDLCRRYKRRYA